MGGWQCKGVRGRCRLPRSRTPWRGLLLQHRCGRDQRSRASSRAPTAHRGLPSGSTDACSRRSPPMQQTTMHHRRPCIEQRAHKPPRVAQLRIDTWHLSRSSDEQNKPRRTHATMIVLAHTHTRTHAATHARARSTCHRPWRCRRVPEFAHRALPAQHATSLYPRTCVRARCPRSRCAHARDLVCEAVGAAVHVEDVRHGRVGNLLRP